MAVSLNNKLFTQIFYKNYWISVKYIKEDMCLTIKYEIVENDVSISLTTKHT